MVLFLNDVAGSEILLILVFILIFFGSKSIPGLARTMGRTIRQVKDASEEIQREIKKSGDDMKKELNLKGLIEETAADVKRPLDQMTNDIDEAIKYTPPNRKSHIQPPVVVEKVEELPEEQLALESELKAEEIIHLQKESDDEASEGSTSKKGN
jgi:sec-independent protein translocase protein TatA